MYQDMARFQCIALSKFMCHYYEFVALLLQNETKQLQSGSVWITTKAPCTGVCCTAWPGRRYARMAILIPLIINSWCRKSRRRPTWCCNATAFHCDSLWGGYLLIITEVLNGKHAANSLTPATVELKMAWVFQTKTFPSVQLLLVSVNLLHAITDVGFDWEIEPSNTQFSHKLQWMVTNAGLQACLLDGMGVHVWCLWRHKAMRTTDTCRHLHAITDHQFSNIAQFPLMSPVTAWQQI